MLNYYYEAIQVNVDETGYCSLRSSSKIDTYGHIYKDKFNPYNPFENLIWRNDDSCTEDQFRFRIDLQDSTTYILVVTTFSPNVTGSFSIIAYGPNNVILKHISEYLYYFVNTQHRSVKYRKCL
jgi:hypothetical protein